MVKKLLALFLIFPLEAFASGGELNWKEFGWRVFTFVIFAGILCKLLAKPIKNILSKRTEEIKEALSQAEKAKDEAEAQVKEYQKKMLVLEKELEAMKANALKAAEKEKENIISDAEKTVAKMKKFAVNMIEAETAKAKADLRKEVADLASAEAEKRIAADFGGDKSKAVLSEYINRIGA